MCIPLTQGIYTAHVSPIVIEVYNTANLNPSFHSRNLAGVQNGEPLLADSRKYLLLNISCLWLTDS